MMQEDPRSQSDIRRCPICDGTVFQTYNTRPFAQCSKCGSLERGRALWMTLKRFELPRVGDRILHLAPEKFIMDRYYAEHSERYLAADMFPDVYKHKLVKVQKLDLCQDLKSITPSSFDFILHNHVLEHVPCPVTNVLRGLAKILRPGGTMVFTVPTRAIEKTDEDLSDTLSKEERRRRFAQADHMRIFGRDVIEIVKKALNQDCFVPANTLFQKSEFEKAGIQWTPHMEPTGNSIFRYIKPEYTSTIN